MTYCLVHCERLTRRLKQFCNVYLFFLVVDCGLVEWGPPSGVRVVSSSAASFFFSVCVFWREMFAFLVLFKLQSLGAATSAINFLR